MPKRGSDADSRIFFDEFVSIGISRLKATDAIRLEDQWARIPFGEQTKLIGVAHTKFPNGGSWSYFVCSQCGRRAFSCCRVFSIKRAAIIRIRGSLLSNAWSRADWALSRAIWMSSVDLARQSDLRFGIASIRPRVVCRRAGAAMGRHAARCFAGLGRLFGRGEWRCGLAATLL
jgi:hypothetical protein